MFVNLSFFSPSREREPRREPPRGSRRCRINKYRGFLRSAAGISTYANTAVTSARRIVIRLSRKFHIEPFRLLGGGGCGGGDGGRKPPLFWRPTSSRNRDGAQCDGHATTRRRAAAPWTTETRGDTSAWYLPPPPPRTTGWKASDASAEETVKNPTEQWSSRSQR